MGDNSAATATSASATPSVKKRVAYYDFLNVAACLCVVFLHANTMVHVYSPGLNWPAGLIIEVVCFWAVPIFFMLSGATLMEYRKRYSTKVFFKKRFVKILIPFIVWSAALYLLRFNATPDFGLYDFLVKLMNNQIETVYWFFFSILSLYLAIPVLSLLSDNKKVLWYLVAVAFVLQSVVPPIMELLHFPWGRALNIPVAGGYVMYLVLGYLLAKTDFDRRTRIIVYCLGIACLIFRYAYTVISSTLLGDMDRIFFSYEYFTAVLPAAAVFLAARYSKTLEKLPAKASSVLSKLASCSFGVYLIHEIVLRDVLLTVFGVDFRSLVFRFVAPIFIYAFCVLVVYILKKIPVLRRIVP